MQKKFEFTDYELEFLEALGITFNNNSFHSQETGNDFVPIKTTYGTVKGFGTDEKFYKYTFKGKDGSIIFLRTNNKWAELQFPSFCLKFNDITLTSKKSTNGAIAYDSADCEANIESAEIIENINRIYVDAVDKSDKIRHACISICPYDGLKPDYDLSRTDLIVGPTIKSVARLFGRLTGLVQDTKETDIRRSNAACNPLIRTLRDLQDNRS